MLNADDALVLKMAGHTEAKHICYVTMNPQHVLVREHIRAGGRACALEDGVNGQMITLYDRGGHIPLLWTHLIPATLEGRAMHNVQNAMFAAAHGVLARRQARRDPPGAANLRQTFFQAPGRMNVFNEHPFKVMFDYAHNAHAVAAMAELAARLDVRGRRIVVVAGPGDRRDEDMVAIANSGRRPIRSLHLPPRRQPARARTDDEVPKMRRRHCAPPAWRQSAIEMIPDEQAAIDAALRMGRPGDLLLVFADALIARGSKSSNSSPTRRLTRRRRRLRNLRAGHAVPLPPPPKRMSRSRFRTMRHSKPRGSCARSVDFALSVKRRIEGLS